MMNVVIKLTCDKIQVFIFSIMLMLRDKGEPPDRATTVHPRCSHWAREARSHSSLSPVQMDASAPEV